MHHPIVILQEQRLTVHQPVVVGKHSPYHFPVLIGDAVKLVFLHLCMMTDDFRSNLKTHCTIFTWFEVFMRTNGECFACLRHLKGRVHADALVTTHLLGIHATHAGADHHIRHYIHAQASQKRQSLGWINRNVGCDDIEIRQ